MYQADDRSSAKGKGPLFKQGHQDDDHFFEERLPVPVGLGRGKSLNKGNGTCSLQL